MSVQPIFPIPDLLNFLLAVLVLPIIVRSRWVVDVIPILGDYGFFPVVLLPLLTTTSLTLLSATAVEPVDVVVVTETGPVC